MVIKGGCRCGAVRYQLNTELKNRCFCHCESCRRSSGAPYLGWGTVSLDQFTVSGEMTYSWSSPKVRRGFCQQCGTNITYQHEARSQDLDITLASLDDPAAMPPLCHIWVSDKLKSVVIGDTLPQHPRWASDD